MRKILEAYENQNKTKVRSVKNECLLLVCVTFRYKLYSHVKMNNKNSKKFDKKKAGKFNKHKPKKPLPRKEKRLLEEDEITKIQESYATLPDVKEIRSFDNFPLSRKTKKGLLANKFRVPTEIQKQSIGLALQGKDILGAAQTGSGKTLGEKFL